MSQLVHVPQTQRRIHLPLYIQVLLGALLGAALGVVFGKEPYLLGLGNADLGLLGMLVIKALRTLAVPLVLFAILDTFLRTSISARHAGQLLVICLVNVSVAVLIGLTLMNTLRPGEYWRGHMDEITAAINVKAAPGARPPKAGKGAAADAPPATLSLLQNLDYNIPSSVVRPFFYNNVISVVLLALFMGAALRRVKTSLIVAGGSSLESIGHVIAAGFQILVQMLEWLVLAVPVAVFGVVAQVVGAAGLGVFSVLWIFLATALLGLCIHALLYFPLVAWLAGGKPPQVYLGQGADAILTGISTNSSLATVPITLRCLTENMGVSQAAARLSALVATNLNKNGITLYEIIATLFLAQAVGMDLGIPQQIVIVTASIMAGVAVAGVPQIGLILLPLVLGAAGLPESLIAVAIPLLLPVDWIIARCRTMLQVMSDMLVAILLDRWNPEVREARPEAMETAA